MGEKGRKKKEDREMQMGLMGCCLSLKQGPAFTCGCDGWKSRPAKHTTIQGIHLQVSRVILAPILPHVRPHSSRPLAMQLSSAVCMRSSAVLYIPCQPSPPTTLSMRRETDVTVTHFDSGPITHHLARLTAMLDPPPTHPLLLPPLSASSLACCYPHRIPYSTCILSSLIYPYCRLLSGIYSLYCCMSCLQLSAAVCPLLSAVCRCLPLVYRCLPLLINKGHLPLHFRAAQIFGAARSL